MMIERTTFLGEEAIFLANDKLEGTIVPALGGSLIALKDKKKDLALIRTPESMAQYQEKAMHYGTPILFPPNRIEDGTFTYGDRTYHFPLTEPARHNHIHGFVHDKKWEIIEEAIEGDVARVSLKIDSASFESIQAAIPQRFSLVISYVLIGSSLHKDITVKNLSQELLPWGIGYHTAFHFPFPASTSSDDAVFTCTVNKQWELNERFLPTGKIVEPRVPMKNGINIEGLQLDDAFLSSVLDGEKENRAVLTDRQSGVEIVYEADEHFKHWVIYNNTGYMRYVCPEPYTWITNAPNLKLPAEITGLQALEPNEEITVRTKISVVHL